MAPSSTLPYMRRTVEKVSPGFRCSLESKPCVAMHDADMLLPEYDDDTTLIPRSTTVVARRLPALKQGHGRAARYVSGKMPVHAKNSSRREQAAKAPTKA